MHRGADTAKEDRQGGGMKNKKKKKKCVGIFYFYEGIFKMFSPR
jgi:hypothetical protein